MSVQCVYLYTERKSQHKHTFHIPVSVVRRSFPPEFRFLQHIIFRFSSFSRILAGNSVIYCGSDWGTFGSSSNSKLCQSTRSFFCLFFFTPPHRPLFLSLTHHTLLFTYVPVDGDVKYLNALCCWGTMHFSRWAIAAQTPMYANLHTKQPRMFSI